MTRLGLLHQGNNELTWKSTITVLAGGAVRKNVMMRLRPAGVISIPTLPLEYSARTRAYPGIHSTSLNRSCSSFPPG